jgi:hypothetical protein
MRQQKFPKIAKNVDASMRGHFAPWGTLKGTLEFAIKLLKPIETINHIIDVHAA